MKSVLMGLLFFISFDVYSQNITFNPSNISSIKSLVGRWESADGGGLEIIDSSRVFVSYGNERKPILSYITDFTKSPIWFDFVVKDTAQKLLTIKSLLLLVNAETLKWQVFEDGDRPSNFAIGKGDIVFLRRKK